MAHLDDYSTENQYQAVIKRSERLTPESTDEVRELLIEIENPEFHCEVDQSVGVLIDTEGDFGKTQHHRLYSVADIPEKVADKTQIKMLVKRCNYIDEFSGELYDGVGSNYLCDRLVGESLTLTGPFPLPFKIPEDRSSNLILIGLGTGIAPFRAFIKHIYRETDEWEGQIRLFYGAKSGLELLYLNDVDGDLTNYYDKETFQAFSALSPRPHWNDPIALDQAIDLRSEEILHLLSQLNTYVYVVGYEAVRKMLDRPFSKILGSEEKWRTRKAELIAGKKWAEVIY
ncbi:MAG: ferredoxin-NADP reductase [bacterium]|nr:ferredoxin-NADP reductase [bacterium]